MPDGTIAIFLRHDPRGGRTWVARVAVDGHGEAGVMQFRRPVGRGKACHKFTLVEGEVYLVKEAWEAPHFLTVRGGEILPLTSDEVKSIVGYEGEIEFNSDQEST